MTGTSGVDGRAGEDPREQAELQRLCMVQKRIVCEEMEMMKRFYAQLNNHQTINRPADRMVLEDNAIRVYAQEELVAFVDVSVVLYAHICKG